MTPHDFCYVCGLLKSGVFCGMYLIPVQKMQSAPIPPFHLAGLTKNCAVGLQLRLHAGGAQAGMWPHEQCVGPWANSAKLQGAVE